MWKELWITIRKNMDLAEFGFIGEAFTSAERETWNLVEKLFVAYRPYCGSPGCMADYDEKTMRRIEEYFRGRAETIHVLTVVK